MKNFKELYNSIPRHQKLNFVKSIGLYACYQFTELRQITESDYKQLVYFIKDLKEKSKTPYKYVEYDMLQVTHYFHELCNFINSASFSKLSPINKEKILTEKQRLKIELNL